MAPEYRIRKTCSNCGSTNISNFKLVGYHCYDCRFDFKIPVICPVKCFKNRKVTFREKQVI